MRVLISAYACEPHKGSEPGAGWNWSLAAARDHEVWVLTRANNQEPIERELAAHSVPNIHFVYIDLPAWARWWKRGQRGARLYYILWQFAALRVARALHDAERFEIVHHLTFANMWLPALVCKLDAPFVYGPMGGGVTIPLRLYPELGVRGACADVLLRTRRVLSGTVPLVRLAWRSADLVIAQNDETAKSFERRGPFPVVVHPNASVARIASSSRPSRSAGRRAICTGRLIPLKGTSLAVKTVARLEGWSLEIVGSGPDERRLRRLVRELELEERVTFTPWLTQDELWERFRSSDALLLPTLKDEASFVAAEAVSLGLPVVAFDHGGPAAIARLAPGAIDLVPLIGDAAELAAGLAAKLAALRIGDRGLPNAVFGPDSLAAASSSFYAAALRNRSRGTDEWSSVDAERANDRSISLAE